MKTSAFDLENNAVQGEIVSHNFLFRSQNSLLLQTS
jgi:hypothetical protein